MTERTTEPMIEPFLTHVDRAAYVRDDDGWLEAAWANGASRAFVIDRGRALVVGGRLVLAAPAEMPAGERLFLGVQENSGDSTGIFAVIAKLPDDAGRDGTLVASLREVGADLPVVEAELLAHAAALEQWHARNRFCPSCGAETVVGAGGHVRRCVGDGGEHFPRTDPAIITLVTDADDRALLGHQPTWPTGRMSTLAGYVEAGETLENAVIREVAEEVGVVVGDVRYVGSQPWPFPASLMLAFTARAKTTDIKPDGAEIVDARWFSRDELKAAVADGSLILPMRSSVAFRLIDTWYGGLPKA